MVKSLLNLLAKIKGKVLSGECEEEKSKGWEINANLKIKKLAYTRDDRKTRLEKGVCSQEMQTHS